MGVGPVAAAASPALYRCSSVCRIEPLNFDKGGSEILHSSLQELPGLVEVRLFRVINVWLCHLMILRGPLRKPEVPKLSGMNGFYSRTMINSSDYTQNMQMHVLCALASSEDVELHCRTWCMTSTGTQLTVLLALSLNALEVLATRLC